jgi:Flp pilus assembly protein TadG
MRHLRRRDRRSRGQSLAEFALVIPIFLLLMVSLFDLGRAVFAYNSVTNAAREGARFAAVNQSSSLIIQHAIAQTQIAETQTPNVTVAFRAASPNADYRTNAVCSTLTLDCVAIVTYQTTFRPITPLVSNIIFSGGVTLQAQSVQQLEFICPNPNVALAANCPKQP